MAIPARAHLISKKSGLAIDIEGANPADGTRAVQWNLTGNAVKDASTTPGAPLVQTDLGKLDHQLWQLKAVS
ncbi:hypothetical protein DP939_21435 [Spongiactinospora rosea]|uniref:Ricin B lectin domain-containing protein n=1 Tax=Spongiactinospora rosea TaxID=2248750 RepID=A0A366LWI5_9ACTN|nr:RICIN domain-containing protein [Spongiactinospora rosea]RBQ17940.1 hypothetical protein DP939_21435 [Spongiactinospora rosea]